MSKRPKATPWFVNYFGLRYVIERYVGDTTERHGGWNDEKQRPNVLYATLDEAREALAAIEAKGGAA